MVFQAGVPKGWGTPGRHVFRPPGHYAVHIDADKQEFKEYPLCALAKGLQLKAGDVWGCTFDLVPSVQQ